MKTVLLNYLTPDSFESLRVTYKRFSLTKRRVFIRHFRAPGHEYEVRVNVNRIGAVTDVTFGKGF